ncbi:MAG TPA: cytochrome c3 family protein [Kofleriaceae bacterium]
MRSSPALAVAAAFAACSGATSSRRPAEPAAPEEDRVSSNILFTDHAGSAACRPCHVDIYKAWQGSPMRTMTRIADSAEIQAPFDGASLRVGDDVAVVETIGGARFMRVTTAGVVHLFRITRVIGGRLREDFAGIEVTGAADPVRDPGEGAEKVLPISYVFSTRSWRYKGYSVMLAERAAMRAGPVWSKTCIGCHNTLPLLSLVYDDLRGPGARGYQGSVSDDLLPADRMWTLEVLDRAGLARAIDRDLARLGAAPPPAGAGLDDVLDRAIDATRQKLEGRHLVEVGIGCEACHGGAALHVANPDHLPSFQPRSPLVRFRPPPRGNPRAFWINRACSRCHTVLFSGYRYTWEGGQRTRAVPGGSSINSGEARDFLLGACSGEMTCVDCHDPHGRDAPEHMRWLQTPAGNRTCIRCHTALGAPAALRAHSHHETGGEAGACLACHMPKKNMSLDYRLTAYHRIGSPNDPARVERDKPLECALCHVDRSVEELVATMERWWGKRYDRAVLRTLYGTDLGVNAIRAALAGKPHEQGTAIGVLGERRVAGAVPELAALLSHRLPILRFFARAAIERITGQPVPVDLHAQAAGLKVEVRKWLAGRSGPP